ncbi:hypothetical protein EJ110_NYTH12001 [Nymphaea thermarum]|nr:hypothetical protein EJ110_NYTH12001 [Nymphaea thermarum]
MSTACLQQEHLKKRSMKELPGKSYCREWFFRSEDISGSSYKQTKHIEDDMLRELVEPDHAKMFPSITKHDNLVEILFALSCNEAKQRSNIHHYKNPSLSLHSKTNIHISIPKIAITRYSGHFNRTITINSCFFSYLTPRAHWPFPINAGIPIILSPPILLPIVFRYIHFPAPPPELCLETAIS